MILNPIKILTTASMMYNTYYPVSRTICLPKKNGGLIPYAGCNWINNGCVKRIEDEYPNLDLYDSVYVKEYDINSEKICSMIVNSNLFDMLPMDYCIMKNKHHIIIDNMHDHQFEIIASPMTMNRTKLFLFSDNNIMNSIQISNRI